MPAASESARQVKSFSIALAIFCMGYTADPKGLVNAFRMPRGLIVGLLMVYAIAPALIYPIGRLAFSPVNEKDIFIGMALIAAATTTVATSIVYTRIAGGNHALAVAISSFANIVGVFITPFLLAIMLKASVEVKALEMVRKMVLLVLAPIVLAQIVRLFHAPGEKLTKAADLTAQVSVLVMVFISTGNAQKVINLALVGKLTVVAALCHCIVMTAGGGRGRLFRLSREDSIAASFTGSQKTITTTTWLAAEYFTPAAAIPIIVYHYMQLFIGHFFVRYWRAREQEGGAE
jgi:predicted Na+-dependent transporter